MSAFSPFALPAGVEPESAVATVPLVEAAVRALHRARPALVARTATDIAEVLGSVGQRFLNEGDPIRTEALDRLPESAALSATMSRAVLDGMAADWTPPRLLRLLDEEFPEEGCLDGLAERGDRAVMAIGPALCTQIVAGSVPGVGVHALIRSLLVKAPTLVKPGMGDHLLPVLFARALREADSALADALAVIYWAGSSAGGSGIAGAAVAEADVVVVYGSDEVTASLRALTPTTARFVGYHHRLGIALVGREALADGKAAEAAAAVARAVAVFEQRGCVCPQRIFVEEGGELGAAAFCVLLGRAFEELESELPGPELDAHSGAALQQLRGTLDLAAESVGATVSLGGTGSAWTLIHESGSTPMLEGPGRIARVRSVADVDEIVHLLRPLGPHLQTVGHVGIDPERTARIAERLGRIGASRLAPIEGISFPPPWWLHDGRAPLRELVRWIELE